jgi:hydroxyacylglutathione hydrolase
MTNRIALLAAALALGVGACSPASSSPQPSTLFARPWNSGVSQDEPAFQAQAIDKDTYAIRQSLHATFEAPFVYLIFGREKALLIDTGDRGAALRPEVDRLVGAWLSANRRQTIPLVVMHSHAHGDHVGGDAGFAGRPDTVVVGHAAADVARFFGIGTWPTQTAAFDLGGRIVDIVPTPGHHPSHAMVFDRGTAILFSGDAVYPGKLYFQCGMAGEYLASINRLADFAATRNVRWLLGAHIEMRAAPGQSFQSDDRVRRDEHRLELPPTVLAEIRQALLKMGSRVRVEAHDDFVLYPYPADPRGKSPPDWCLAAN